MTNAELIAKIRAEIERRIRLYDMTNEKEAWIIITYKAVLSFLDTLEPEKPIIPVNLEEEIRDYMSERWKFGGVNPTVPVYLYDFTTDELKELARHFYELGQKNKPNIEICPHSIRSKSFSMRKEQPVDICINTPTYSPISTEPGKDGSSEKPNNHLEVLDEAADNELANVRKELHEYNCGFLPVHITESFKHGAEWAFGHGKTQDADKPEL